MTSRPRFVTPGVRAGIVVTGTEVLTGRVADRNGPWLAEELRRLGVDLGRIVVVGDRPDDLVAALGHLRDDHDLVITTGGLGPTADDLTARIVGDVQGRPSKLDAALYATVRAIVAQLVRRRGLDADPEALDAGSRKQAMVPVGAQVLAPVGTAPGLVVPPAEGRSGPPVVVLPGPPVELRAMWPAAVAAPAVRAVLDAASPLLEDTILLWGTLEADLAATLRRIEADLVGIEVGTCLRGGELEVVTRYTPADADRVDLLRRTVLEAFPTGVFSTDGRTVDDLIGDTLVARGWTVGVGESCTGGLLGARLTARAGSSAYVLGSVAAYHDRAKTSLLGVPPELIEAHGAVSVEVAEALADGARRAFGADVGIGLTGIAGPGGATADKPVGTVELALVAPSGRRRRTVRVPRDRQEVRTRSVTAALHELRLLLGDGG